MEDFETWCTCDACSAETRKYGTDAAVVVKFCNKLSRKMEAYVTELHKDEPNFEYNIDLNFFAYKSTVPAPTTYDSETDTYSPIDETVKCDPHVVPWYAPIYIDYTQSIYEDINLSYYQNIRAWDAISETMHLWTYETCFKAYMAPYDSFNGMQDLFQVLAATNADFLFNQSQWNHSKAGTAWHALKSYLTAKLSWDSTQNINELIDRFFNAMYGPAANTMREWFNSTRAYCAYLHSQGLYKGTFTVYFQAYSSDYWSYSILRTWMGYADKALSEIEKYKTANPALYQKYYEHIVTDRISPNYLMLTFYESRLNKDEARAILNDLKVDSVLCGVTAPGEGGSFQAVLDSIILQD